MRGKEAKELTGRSRKWMCNRACPWCGQTLWRALLYGCGAIYSKCDPAQRVAGIVKHCKTQG